MSTRLFIPHSLFRCQCPPGSGGLFLPLAMSISTSFCFPYPCTPCLFSSSPPLVVDGHLCSPASPGSAHLSLSSLCSLLLPAVTSMIHLALLLLPYVAWSIPPDNFRLCLSSHALFLITCICGNSAVTLPQCTCDLLFFLRNGVVFSNSPSLG